MAFFSENRRRNFSDGLSEELLTDERLSAIQFEVAEETSSMPTNTAAVGTKTEFARLEAS